MKKFMTALVMVFLSASVVCAEWLVEFRDTYVSKGVDKAVEDALKNGKNPDLIVEAGLEIQGLNPQNLVRALYCAGASGQDIRAAAEKYKITEPIVAAAYKKSIDECGDRVADSQAYTPVGGGPSFSTPSGGRNGSYASASRFR